MTTTHAPVAPEYEPGLGKPTGHLQRVPTGHRPVDRDPILRAGGSRGPRSAGGGRLPRRSRGLSWRISPQVRNAVVGQLGPPGGGLGCRRPEQLPLPCRSTGSRVRPRRRRRWRVGRRFLHQQLPHPRPICRGFAGQQNDAGKAETAGKVVFTAAAGSLVKTTDYNAWWKVRANGSWRLFSDLLAEGCARPGKPLIEAPRGASLTVPDRRYSKGLIS